MALLLDLASRRLCSFNLFRHVAGAVASAAIFSSRFPFIFAAVSAPMLAWVLLLLLPLILLFVRPSVHPFWPF